jgi:hypothetical protein
MQSSLLPVIDINDQVICSLKHVTLSLSLSLSYATKLLSCGVNNTAQGYKYRKYASSITGFQNLGLHTDLFSSHA